MKTSVVTIHQAKANLSRLIQKASGGEEVIIARGSKPVARLIAFEEAKGKRQPGALKGKLVVGPEFFEHPSVAEPPIGRPMQAPFQLPGSLCFSMAHTLLSAVSVLGKLVKSRSAQAMRRF